MKYILHYLEPRQTLAQKALIAAKYNGIAVEQRKIKTATDSNVKLSPVHTLPFLETDFGVVFASNAIARYIASTRQDTGLRGDGFHESIYVDSWTEFCARELEVPMSIVVLLSKGESGLSITKAAFDAAKKDIQAALKKLEERLHDRTYLVGSKVTLADIVVACSLVDGFTSVLDAAFRKPFPKVAQWLSALLKEPHFSSVLGPVKLCDKEPKLTFATAPQGPTLAKDSAPKEGSLPKATAKKQAAPPSAAPAVASSSPALTGSPEDIAAMEAQKLKVRDLKTAKASAEEVTAAVAELKRLKEVCGEVDPPKSKKGKK